MHVQTCTHIRVHACVCVCAFSKLRRRRQSKTKAKLLWASSCCCFCFVIRNCFGLCAESCFEIGYSLIPRSSEVEANEWLRWKLCRENVNNKKLPALSLTNWSCSHALMRALCLSLPLSLYKLRHMINKAALLLSFSRTSAGNLRIGLATPCPVLPLRYTQFQCQGCPQTCTVPSPSYLSVVLSLSSHWVTLKERKGSSCFTATTQ